MTESHHQDTPPQDAPTTGPAGNESLTGAESLSGQAVVDAARTGLYAAAGLADAMAGAVKQSYLTYQEGARERRAKRSAQAEDVKNFITDAPTNLPEQAREWPDQMRARAEEFVAEARTAIVDLAERGRQAVDRVRTEGFAGVNPPTADAADATATGDPADVTGDAEAASTAAAAEAEAMEPLDDTPETADPAATSEGSVTEAPGAGFAAPEPQGDVTGDEAATDTASDDLAFGDDRASDRSSERDS